MAIQHGWQKSIVESDSFSIVNCLHVSVLDCSVASTFLIEMVGLLREHAHISICHVAWAANRVAYKLTCFFD
ncbi:hypothetical protein V6N13_001569 [Hibiscus sabdariffa]|uniref:RNase H type-1 domain-containing protein n=1 Tax=Hibiscus sabdariffa TaxID=183260 RepID=A0ABR2G9N4_9ROSI